MTTNKSHKYKVFVSYKYHDNDVYPLNPIYDSDDNMTTARSYVNYLEKRNIFDNIYKGEKDNTPLNDLADNTIYDKLKDSLADSSITLVLISPNMKDPLKEEKGQWIPREISYSLKEITRGGICSRTNKVAGIILPDGQKSYSYILEPKTTKNGKHYTLEHTDLLFDIINKNRRNIKGFEYHTLDNQSNMFYEKECYIRLYKWDSFIANPNKILNEISKINCHEYSLKKEL